MTRCPGPLGTYLIVSSQRGLVYVSPEDQAEGRFAGGEQGASEHNTAACRELTAYFEGKLRRFTVLLDLRGTPFQLRVWHQLLQVPYGETRSYADLARALGKPAAARAVGGAVGSNPVSIIVPCHRIIGSDGSPTGYGSGLHRKQALLDLEAAHRAR